MLNEKKQAFIKFNAKNAIEEEMIANSKEL